MRKRILIIDDDHLVVTSLKRYLKSRGYDVETAESGQEAITKSENTDFDLLVSDIRMPGMSGLEAIRKIKRLYEKKVKGKKLPVIVITGYSGEDVDKQSADLGIVDLLYKPFELNEFIKLIKRNLEHVPIYKRAHPRISSSFRVYVKEGDLSDASTDIKGRALNLSEGGVCLSAKEKLHKEEEPVWLHIVPPHSKLRIETKGKVIWAKLTDENKFRYGLQFLNITARDYDMLRQILSQYKRLNPMFVELTNELHDFLQKTKDIFDKFNNSEPSEKEQVNFIMKHRDAVDEKLTVCFDKIWELIKDFDKDKYTAHQNYFQQRLGYLLLKNSDINNRIYQKPFGYPGDYMIIDYLYDYQGNKYLGATPYEKLINNYTCSIPISYATSMRKEFFKQKILDSINTAKKARALCVGCGSAREMTELVGEGKIVNPLLFHCLDFEKKALERIQSDMKLIPDGNKRRIKLKYVQKDIISILKDASLQRELKGQDLIYSSGLFDYLSDRMAKTLIEELYKLLNKKGLLVVSNASLEKCSHRAYYELLGEWHLIYRTEQDMLTWTENIKNPAFVRFEQPANSDSYIYLCIGKP